MPTWRACFSSKAAPFACFARATSDRGNIANLDVEVAEGDLRDPESVARAVRGCAEVYHVAAEYSFWSPRPDELYRSNVDGTTHVFDACLRHDVERVVYTSTVGTIGLAAVNGDALAVRDENTPLAEGQLAGHYKRSKFDAEQVAFAYAARGLPVVIVNPSAPVGAWDRKPTPTGQIIVDFMRGRLPAFVQTVSTSCTSTTLRAVTCSRPKKVAWASATSSAMRT